MRINVRHLLLVALALCGAQSVARAQNVCDLKDSGDTCVQKFEKRMQVAAQRTKSQALAAGATANTGNANATSATPTSSFTDFFNTLHAAANTGGSGKDDPQALAFELNECGVPNVPGQKLRCQIRGRLEQPKIYDPLKKALQQAQLSDRATAIEDDLGLADKLTAGVFLSLVTDSMGRELTTGNNRLFQELQNEAMQVDGNKVSVYREQAAKRNGAYAEYLNELAQKDPRVAAVLTAGVPIADIPFERLPEEVRQDALNRFEAVAAANVQYNDSRSKALTQTGYFELANLLNNQPQPLAGIEYGAIQEFAGPDELRFKVSYEKGFVNINSFRGYQQAVCKRSADLDVAQSTAICLRQYLDQPGVKTSLASGSRFAFTLEHVRRKRFAISVPDTTVTLNEAPVRSWIGALTVGRYLDPVESQAQLTRLDISASYEDVSNDPKRQDRGIASATLTRKLSGDWLLAFGLVYATKPEFRAEADKDLSLRLGLNYKILRKTN